MLKLKQLPVANLRQGKITMAKESDFDFKEDDEGEVQFKDSDIGIANEWNSVRNTVIRGYHKDDMSGDNPAIKIKSIRQKKEDKLKKTFNKDFILREQARNQNDRGFKKLDEFQERKKQKLEWRPEYDDLGEPGVDSGISTEQGDPLVDIKKDSFQDVSIVEPYVVSRRFASMKLKSLN